MRSPGSWLVAAAFLLTLGCGRPTDDSTVAGAAAPTDSCQTIDHDMGLSSPIVFPDSQPKAGRFGIRTTDLIGNWKATDFPALPADGYNQHFIDLIASHAANCFTDPLVGRITPQMFAVKPNDVDSLKDVVNMAVTVKRELLVAEMAATDPKSLSDEARNLAPQLNAYALQAESTFTRSVATNLGWVVQVVDATLSTVALIAEGSELTNELIANSLPSNPGLKEPLINRLKNNTAGVMNDFGFLFGKQARAKLQADLDGIKAIQTETDIKKAQVALGAWAMHLKDASVDVFDDKKDMTTIAMKLNFIFGSCINSATNYAQFFTQRTATDWMAKQGQDPVLCNP